jgi:hypothetical protein
MSKLTSSDKEKIMVGLIEVFKPYEAEDSVLFYYDNKRARVDPKTGELVVEEGFNPRDYFDYCNENTVSLSFDGSLLYEILNGYAGTFAFEKVDEGIRNVVDPYGLYYELGNAWNLSFYDSGPNGDNEPEPRKEPIRIYHDTEVPEELQAISDWWIEQANAYGDKGSCVIGAGFKFRYQEKLYFMPPLSKWQGSCSWEASKDQVKEKLEAVGAVEITYNWGVMD